MNTFESVRIYLDTQRSDGAIRGYNYTHTGHMFVFYVEHHDGTQSTIKAS
jgi:hypothetical protein